MEHPDDNAHLALRPFIKAHFHFQFLSAAFELGLFGLLAKHPGLTAREIAGLTGLNHQPTRILLLGCTATGLLRKEGDGYHNTPLGEPLSGAAERAPASYLPWEKQGIYRAIGWFSEALQEDTNVGLHREFPGTAPTLYGRLSENPDMEQVFHTMMSSVSTLVAGDLTEKLDLSAYRSLLDVGGGAAINATNLAGRWPRLSVTIADLPTVAESARKKIAETGLEERVRTAELDAFRDEFPRGHDAVLFAHFLEIWSADRVRALLSKAARALSPGGGIFVVTPYQNDEQTGPVRAAYLSAYFHTIASGEGMVYTCREYESWFREADLEPTGRVMLGPDTVVICGRKP
ncbi:MULTISPECIES: methyltransferase [unclassified Streptomyces]|jgi:ubiquinone/menaquinone biosynthesis C-methylase UbiE|uniref:methyltransferase n=1 Tax=unclassified Streptomyces TaxID=2593676 RepID=UPI000A1F7FC4|nr:methyltransferase [Streptomyces sp. 13-12-16]OSP44734.1 methyltransferase [Streptomyces sp. 13-12-16]